MKLTLIKPNIGIKFECLSVKDEDNNGRIDLVSFKSLQERV